MPDVQPDAAEGLYGDPKDGAHTRRQRHGQGTPKGDPRRSLQHGGSAGTCRHGTQKSQEEK